MSKSERTIRLSPSHIEQSLKAKPHLQRYVSHLKAIDKDGNGEVDMVELCEVLEELESSYRARRILKWVAVITGLFCLLSIASIVGLTYAVVDLQKDTSVSNQSLVVKGSPDQTLATAKATTSVGLASLVSSTPDELVKLETVILPLSNNRTEILHIADLELDQYVSLTLTSASGKTVIISADGSVTDVDVNAMAPGGSVAGVNATVPGGSRRRLLNADASGGSAQLVDCNPTAKSRDFGQATDLGTTIACTTPAESPEFNQMKLPRGQRHFITFFKGPLRTLMKCVGPNIYWKARVYINISTGGSGKDEVNAPFVLQVRDQTGQVVGSVDPYECSRYPGPVACNYIKAERQKPAADLNFPTLSFQPRAESDEYSFGIELTVNTDDWVLYNWEGTLDSN